VSTFRKILSAAFFFVLGGMLSACAIGFHVVRSDIGMLAVRKTRPTVKDFYVDIRRWNRQDWKAHPDLAKALAAAGHQDLVPRQRPAAGPLPFNIFRWNSDRRNDAKDGRRSEIRGRRSEVGGRKTEVGGRISDRLPTVPLATSDLRSPTSDPASARPDLVPPNRFD